MRNDENGVGKIIVILSAIENNGGSSESQMKWLIRYEKYQRNGAWRKYY